MKRIACTATVLALFLLNLAGAAVADESGRQRAAWLLQRGQLAGAAPGDTRYFQKEIGSYGGAREDEAATSGGSDMVGLKVLASVILPGSGEALMGYKRGYFLMAADILAWTQVFGNDKKGDEKLDEYYDFADAHYTDELLVEAYRAASLDIERNGLGAGYFPDVDNIETVEGLAPDGNGEGGLPLYVSKEDDRREYYENLGKWDQFVFGWDDFKRPEAASGASPIYRLSDLSQPGVSANREIYRSMRKESNDYYKTRDRWLYVNIGLRVFSIVQTAWLGGLLGGDGDEQMAVAGYPIQLVAAPQGAYRGRVGAKVRF